MKSQLSSARVLIVAAHADDEILGAGGALAQHAARGDSLFILVLSASSTSRSDQQARQEKDPHRAKCVQRVAHMYGAQWRIGDFLDNAFDTTPQLALVKEIEETVRSFKPTVVYTHSLADLSRDHELTARATATATRPVPGSSVQLLLSFEVSSATEWGIGRHFHPTWFISLPAAAVAMKMSALQIYESEMRHWPHSRSIKAIEAMIRVRGSQVGQEAAEAFELIRHVVMPDFDEVDRTSAAGLPR